MAQSVCFIENTKALETWHSVGVGVTMCLLAWPGLLLLPSFFFVTRSETFKYA